MRGQRRNSQRGLTVAMVALCIVVLFLMAALAVDLGVLYTARTSAQHAADAAALAGAYTFLSTTAPQPASAQNAAVATAGANQILGTPVTINTGNITVDTANRRVTVTVPRTGATGNAIGTFFARVSGTTSADVVAKATAEAGQQGSASRCVKPIFLRNTTLSGNDPVTACKRNEVIFNSDGTVSDFAKTKFGSSIAIRPVNPSGALVSSQFYSLDFGAGANTYRCAWGECLNYCAGTSVIACGSKYPLKTGNMNGPTKQGVDDLIGRPPDQWINGVSPALYDVNGSRMDTSKSLIIAPVWNDCDPANPIDPGTGGQMVQVAGFLEMFVDGMQGLNVQAHVVQPIACSNPGAGGGAGNPNPSTGPMATPVRLIQTSS